MRFNDKQNAAPMSADDQEYLKGLFLANYAALMKYAQTVCKGASCEDFVQETFLIASTKAGAVRESPNPAGWLMRTLQNVLKKALSKSAPISFEDGMSCQKESYEPAFEGFTLLSETCRRYLSEEDWELLYKKSQGYTSKELAEEYNLRESACKMRLSRARSMLREKLSLHH